MMLLFLFSWKSYNNSHREQVQNFGLMEERRQKTVMPVNSLISYFICVSFPLKLLSSVFIKSSTKATHSLGKNSYLVIEISVGPIELCRGHTMDHVQVLMVLIVMTDTKANTNFYHNCLREFPVWTEEIEILILIWLQYNIILFSRLVKKAKYPEDRKISNEMSHFLCCKIPNPRKQFK